MFTTQMKTLTPIQLSFEQQAQKNQQQETIPFQDIFETAVKDAYQKEKELEQSQYLLATGQIDDPHTVPAAAAQAQLSVDLMVQLRNKALDAYNELMRINL